MAHISVKSTIYIRYSIEDKDVENFMKLDEKEKHNEILNLIEDAESEIEYDTQEMMTYEENSNNPTITLSGGSYPRSKTYWDNTPLDVKRQQKIEQIQK